MSKGFDGIVTVLNNDATAVSTLTSAQSWRASSWLTSSSPAPAVVESMARCTLASQARSDPGS